MINRITHFMTEIWWGSVALTAGYIGSDKRGVVRSMLLAVCGAFSGAALARGLWKSITVLRQGWPEPESEEEFVIDEQEASAPEGEF